MVENNVEDNTQPLRVCRGYQLDERPAVAKTGIDLQEILNAIAVIGVEMAALLENGTDPERRNAQITKVAELGLDAAERATLPALRARLRPTVPSPRFAIRQVWPRGVQVLPVQQRACLLLSIAEAIRQQKIEDLISPVPG